MPEKPRESQGQDKPKPKRPESDTESDTAYERRSRDDVNQERPKQRE